MEDWLLKKEPSYRYQMLDRLRQDCDYYLRLGTNNPGNLWAEDEITQIIVMKMLWESFPEEDKPEWLTWEQILDYERRLCTDLDEPLHYFRKNREDDVE